MKLDEYHWELLRSENDDEMLRGLLSVVYWGFYSGTDGRETPGRALSRAKWVVCGNSRVSPTERSEILRLLRCARSQVDEDRPGEALKSLMRIKHIGMSFASKVVAFMRPEACGVYDKIIAGHLTEHSVFDRAMVVSTNSVNRERQGEAYAGWCRWCREQAVELNDARSKWTDWDDERHEWRAVDVERSIFHITDSPKGRSAGRADSAEG